MLNIQIYKKVESLEEAYELNQKRTNRIIGGMMWLRMGQARIQTAIDMSGLGLDTIEETQEEFKIGCMVSLRQLEVHEGFNTYTQGMAKEALRHIVGVQFRNLATVGGSIFGRYGFSDVLTLLLGLDTYVELYKGGQVPLAKFAKSDYNNDILVNVIVKKKPVKVFYEAVRITQTDLPVLTCCGVRFLENDIKNIVIGARPARAIRVEDKEEILSNVVDEDTIKAFSQYAKKTVATQSNMRGSAEYRSHLVEVLTSRALQSLYLN